MSIYKTIYIFYIYSFNIYIKSGINRETRRKIVFFISINQDTKGQWIYIATVLLSFLLVKCGSRVFFGCCIFFNFLSKIPHSNSYSFLLQTLSLLMVYLLW